MRTIKRSFSDLGASTLLLGKVGENGVTKLEIDASKEISEYPNSYFELMLCAPESDEPYPVVINCEGNFVTYTFLNEDLRTPGYGRLELLLVGADGSVLKSTTVKTRISQSLSSGVYPGPLAKWIELTRTLNDRLEELDSVCDHHSHENLEVLNTITEELIDSWNAAAEDSHSHENLEILDTITEERTDAWDTASEDSHTHHNASSLNRLLIVDQYTDLPENAENGTFAAVAGTDVITKSFAEYDAETDQNASISFVEELTYDRNAEMSDDVLIVNFDEAEITIGVIPVYDYWKESNRVFGGIGAYIVGNDPNDPSAYPVQKKYMVSVALDFDESKKTEILEEYGVEYSSDDDISIVFVYSFDGQDSFFVFEDAETVHGVFIQSGWNICFVIANENDKLVIPYWYADPNTYSELWAFESVKNEKSSLPLLYDVLRVQTEMPKRNLYYKDNGVWKPYYNNEITEIDSRVNDLEHDVDAMRDDLPTSNEVAQWNAAATNSHTHVNAQTLEKLLIVDKYADLQPNAENGCVAAVVGIDGADKSLSQYDAETDAETPLTLAPSLVYNVSAQISDAVLVVKSADDIGITLLPVCAFDAQDPTVGGAGLIFTTAQSDPKSYMVLVSPESTTDPGIFADFGVEVVEEEETGVIFIYAFETVTGDLKAASEEDEGEFETLAENVQIVQGWNAGLLTESGVSVVPLTDPNAYCDLGALNGIVVETPQHPFLYDVLRLAMTLDKRGIYVKTAGDWVRVYGAELGGLSDRLSVLENGEPDDVTLLGFETYSDLILRDDAVETESIQDVPVFTQGSTGDIIALYAFDEEADSGELEPYDMIALAEFHQNDTGMPIRAIRVKIGDNYAYYLPNNWNDFGRNVIAAGWNNSNGQPCSAPTISFAPNRVRFANTVYDNLSDLPAAAKSALRSLSQCINVSAEAMGTIHVPEDSVVRFAGTIEPNCKYAFRTNDDCVLALPKTPWSEKDSQFVLYLTCLSDIDITFESGTYISNEINSDAGKHKLIGCWLKDAQKWAVGSVDYEVPT